MRFREFIFILSGLLLSATINASPISDLGPEYTYKCQLVGSEFGVTTSRTLYLKWRPDAYGTIARVDDGGKLLLDDGEFFNFKPGASITIEDLHGVDQVPFYTIAGTHGGSEYLRGFFIRPTRTRDLSSLHVRTHDGRAVLTELGWEVAEFEGTCKSIGIGRAFPEANP